MRKTVLLTMALCVLVAAPPVSARGDTPASVLPVRDKDPQEDPVSRPFRSRFVHKFGTEIRPAWVAPTHAFLGGENDRLTPIDLALSGHLKYAFQFRPGTCTDRISGSAYQGIGISGNTFFNRDELGNPVVLYLLQGARIAWILPHLSLNYEWNFGLSSGWQPYDAQYNELNKVIGSRVNAYLNADFYLNYTLSRRVDLTAGIALSHFSNGSTRLPNGGLNTIGLTFGALWNLNRPYSFYRKPLPLPGPAFRRHMSYEAVLFGSWREKAYRSEFQEGFIVSPDTYTILGFTFAAMYNLGYKFRAGASLDGVYDGSANVFEDESQQFRTPAIGRQLALGISGKVDYVMPYFTVTVGLGANVLHGGGDLKAFYQTLALKIDVTRRSFVHIGYSLRAFKAPNFLMLGIGYRFGVRPQTYLY